MTTQLLLAATGVYLAFLIAAVYFTRATPRRVAGALAGGAAVAVVGVGVEFLCQSLGVWRYPSDDRPYGPPLMYPAVVLMFALLPLLGWRVSRRFGWRGQAVFLAAVTTVGTVRDYLVGQQALAIITFAPGVGTVLVDAACWAGLTELAQAVMRLVAGPARSDPLARQPADKR
jgi:hypothetical protein